MRDDLKKITPDSRGQLIGLVNKTAELVVGGATPTEALVKAAGDQNYSPEFVLRAAEAYNGAAHLQHFKAAALDSRGDSFDLVDGRQVLRDLIANKNITKAASVDSADFFSDSRYYFDVPANNTPMQKAAASVPAAKVDFKDVITNTRKLEDKEKVAEETARQALLTSFETLDTKLSTLRKKLSNLDPSELTKVGSELVYTYGLPAFSTAVSLCGMTVEDCTKMATSSDRKFRSISTEEIKAAFDLVDACEVCHTNQYILAEKQADIYTNTIERTRATNLFLGISDEPHIDADKIAATTDAGDLNDINTKAAVNLTGSVAGTAIFRGMDSIYNPVGEVTGRMGHPGNKSDAQLAGIQSLLDPAFLQEVKEVEMATMMKKILQDPIISTHSPRAIEEALYEVQSIAPQATTYEPLLRSMLRKRLEAGGQFDDVEINQLLDVDAKIEKRDVPDDLFPVYNSKKDDDE